LNDGSTPHIGLIINNGSKHPPQDLKISGNSNVIKLLNGDYVINLPIQMFLCHHPSARPEKMTAHPHHWPFGREIFVKWVIMCIFKD
jgi:hypothetical protein